MRATTRPRSSLLQGWPPLPCAAGARGDHFLGQDMPSHGIGRTSGCRAAVYAAAFAAAVAATLAAVMRIAVPLACTRLAAVARAARARRLHTCRPSPSSGRMQPLATRGFSPRPHFRAADDYYGFMLTRSSQRCAARPPPRPLPASAAPHTQSPHAHPRPVPHACAPLGPPRAAQSPHTHMYPHGRWFPSARTRWRPRSAVRRVRGGVGQVGT